MADVLVGLGANVGDAAHNLRSAVARLRDVMEMRAVSSLYRTEPVGLREQPFFLNAVMRGETLLGPRALVGLFAEIESVAGRVRDVPLGPRPLDIDLLLYDDRVIDEPGLCVPHPRMTERRFVLAPLGEIAPDVVHPVLGCRVAELLAALPEAESVRRLLAEDWPPLP